MQNMTKRLSMWALIVAAALMIPLIAQWLWTGSDYIFAAVLLFGSATIYELLTKEITEPKRRMIIGLIVVIILLVIWVGFATGFEGIIDRLS